MFSFESGSDSDIRDVFDENDIEIVSTDGDGNVLFIVYGYMNRGGHEGKVGIGFYRYESENNIVEEVIDNTVAATDREKEEIERLLKVGIFI